MDLQVQAHPQPRYLPAVIPVPSTVKHSLRKLSIATVEAPDRICGLALRVGFTGPLETDLALYRLKLKRRSDLSAVTLPGFFVLEDGVFRLHQDA